jgi:hypothetical protein
MDRIRTSVKVMASIKGVEPLPLATFDVALLKAVPEIAVRPEALT